MPRAHFEKQRTTHFDLIDDYILTVRIDAETTRRIECLFAKIRTAKDLALAREFDSIKSNAKVTLQLEKSEKKAKKLRRQFQDYFGISRAGSLNKNK